MAKKAKSASHTASKAKTTRTSSSDRKGTGKKRSPAKETTPTVSPEIIEPNSDTNLSDEIRLDLDEGLEPLENETIEAELLRDSELPAPIPAPSSKSATTTAVATADPVSIYMAEIRNYPLLTKEQEHELAIRYRESGDAKAAEMLVTSNLRFVVKIAAEYSRFGARLIDLIQEGNVGLMHAVKEFNPYKGVRLITYAVWWIRGYIQEYLMRQYSMVRIGTTQNQRKLFYRLQKEKDLLDSMGAEPDLKLLSSRLGVSEQEVVDMTQRLSGRDISLNQPLDTGSNTSLLDFEASGDTAVDDQLGHAEEIQVLRQNIEAIRDELNEKESYILENRILSDEPMTLQEIGDHFGVTREAVRQLEARLINRIRAQFNQTIGEDSENP